MGVVLLRLGFLWSERVSRPLRQRGAFEGYIREDILRDGPLPPPLHLRGKSSDIERESLDLKTVPWSRFSAPPKATTHLCRACVGSARAVLTFCHRTVIAPTGHHPFLYGEGHDTVAGPGAFRCGP